MSLGFWDFHGMIDEETANKVMSRIGTACRLRRMFISMQICVERLLAAGKQIGK